ncbi:MAG: SPASM domain-containing protein [Planctomycetota bacterium]
MNEVCMQIAEKRLESLVDIDCSRFCQTGNFGEACYAGSLFFSVKSNGDVAPCIFSDCIFGNIFLEDFGQIWTGSAAISWRDLISGVCLGCERLSACSSACRCLLAQGLLTDLAPYTERPRYSQSMSEPLRLYGGLRVVSRFFSYPGHHGVFLVQGKHVRYVDNAFQTLVNKLDEELTLANLVAEYGEESLEHVLDLYFDNMVDLVP